MVYRAPYSDYFHTDTKAFPAIEFLVEVLQHLPDPRSRLIRTYGLYSSRARGTPGPTGRRRQPFRRNGESQRLRAERVVAQPSPRPPRSRGLEARLSTPTIRPHRAARGAAARVLGVGHAEPRRLGSPDQEGLRGGSLGRQQVEDLREPPELPSLSQTHESHRRDHRPRAGPQDPATPHQDREAATGPGPRLPELISSPCLRGGSLSLRYPCTGAPSACAHRNTPKLPISP